MPNELKLTLGELNQAALGVTTLTEANIALLHNLMSVILQKLDCKNEVVTFSDQEAQCVRTLRNTSHAPVLHFDDEHVQVFMQDEQRISDLRNELSKLEDRLEVHFDVIRQACHRKRDPTLGLEQCNEVDTVIVEDSCAVCSPSERIACNLLADKDFMYKLLLRVVEPIISDIKNVEEKVDELEESLNEMISQIEKSFKFVTRIKELQEELQRQKERFQAYYEVFLVTMGELHDALDTKLDKKDMPPLKKYIETRIEYVEKQIAAVLTEKKCPKANISILNDMVCLHSEDKEELKLARSSAEEIHQISLPPQWKTPKLPCICDPGEPALSERISGPCEDLVRSYCQFYEPPEGTAAEYVDSENEQNDRKLSLLGPCRARQFT